MNEPLLGPEKCPGLWWREMFSSKIKTDILSQFLQSYITHDGIGVLEWKIFPTCVFRCIKHFHVKKKINPNCCPTLPPGIMT